MVELLKRSPAGPGVIDGDQEAILVQKLSALTHLHIEIQEIPKQVAPFPARGGACLVE